MAEDAEEGDVESVEVAVMAAPIELPDEVVAAFACFLAEEIVDLEEELAASRIPVVEAVATASEVELADDEIAAEITAELDMPAVESEPLDLPENIANDDVPAPKVRAVDPLLP